MTHHNAYLQYKRDTNRLIYWLIHTSNRLSQNLSKANEPAKDSDFPTCPPPGKITTPEITLSTILSIANFIGARNTLPIPASIYGLFESVIAAREKACSFFQQFVTDKPDPEIEEGNKTHRAFLDTLIAAYKVLGGETWKQQKDSNSDASSKEDDTTFVNTYSCLTLDDEDQGEGEEESTAKENQPIGKRGKGGKSKRGKGKNRSAKEKKKACMHPEPAFQDIPLESYRIVDEKSTVTDYLIAIYELAREMSDLRSYTQSVWQKVMQGKLNHAAAGAMCNMAVAVVKQLQFEITSDFPGNESFDAILNAITRGNPDTAQGKFHISLWKIGPDGAINPAKQVDIDVKECFMAHAYWDLLAFIQDFQKNRTGKPTKAMLAKLKDWDPNLDLKTASSAKRNEWRTVYTINWLYDLILLCSSVVLQRRNGVTTGKPQNFILENVDWSPDGEWAVHRVLWGPLEFASDITAFAMSKPGTDIKPRILPHHVFQMQCIVDSFAISRGWSYRPMAGHVHSTPPTNYDPLCDIKHFQDRPNRGINYSMDLFSSVLEGDAARHPASQLRSRTEAEMLPLLKEDFNHWLGSSKLAYGLKTLPASRFSNTDTNGLWKYSPYLCGTGLADALEYAYNYGMLIWDRHPEPTAILHLYNMLCHTGYLKQKIEVFEQCIDFFGETIFVGGQPPTDRFFQSWKATCGMLDVLGVSVFRRTPRRTAIGSTTSSSKDINSTVLSTAPKRIFKRKSLLALLKATNWRPQNISVADIPKFSILNGMRLSMENNKSGGRRTGTPGLDDATSRISQLPVSSPLDIQNQLKTGQEAEISPEVAEQLKRAMGIPLDYTMGPIRGKGNIYGNEPLQLSNREYLEVFQRDVVGDIYGNICPLSAVSYLHILAMVILIFMDIETEGQHLEEIREATSGAFKEPRVTLVTWALQSMNPELLAFIAERMSKLANGLGCGEFSYFPRFVDIWERNDGERDQDEFAADKYEGDGTRGPEDQCNIM